MSKLKHLQQALNQTAAKPQPATKAEPPPPVKEAPPASAAPARQPSRLGKKNIGAWLDPNFTTSLRLVQIRKGSGVYLDDLMAEALNDLFQKYDVPTVLHEKTYK